MTDTIAAIATAQGSGGIAILRLSGPDAERILRACFVPARPLKRLRSHRMYYGSIVRAGETVDEVMAVLMRGPNSYTREDVIEIHCHGGRVCAARVLDCALELGARPAEPGEFTRRAFLNGRIDLSRAEAVMQVIGAGGEAAARASVRQLEGGVSAFVEGVSRRLTDALSLIEASTDFPDEVEEEAAAQEVEARMRELADELLQKADGRGARILREGASIVLSGKPNVGKSSLMNALLSQERAIVTEVPGTTRDVLTERIVLGGVVAELSDTAGLRSAQDPAEQMGVERAQKAAESADIVLCVLDASAPLDASEAAMAASGDARCVVCLNKCDLPISEDARALQARCTSPVFHISARTGAGVDALAAHLQARLAGMAGDGDGLTVQRHLTLAREAAEGLLRGADAISAGFPLDAAAIDLRGALESLGRITGRSATEDVIDSVFANFCVGK